MKMVDLQLDARDKPIDGPRECVASDNGEGPDTGGAWFSISWLFVFFILYVVGSTLYLFFVEQASGFDEKQFEAYLNGPDSNAGVTFFGWLFVFPALALAARSISTKWWQGLGLVRFDMRSLLIWLLILQVYIVLEGLAIHLLQIDIGDFMRQLVGKTDLPLILSAIVLAPVAEELLFRGYLFGVWRNTAIGLPGALLLTSLLFTVAHWGQYGIIPLGFIFCFSIVMGLAREKSGSVWVPIILHGVMNSVSLITLNFFGWV